MIGLFSLTLCSLSLLLMSKFKYMSSFLIILLFFCMPSFTSSFTKKMFNHSMLVCLDNSSSFLVALSMWITMLMFLSMKKAKKLKYLGLCFSSLNTMLMLSFMSKSLMSFYMFFELSLMPTLVMMLGWGAQPERMRAGSYLIIYTLIGSLPLLGAILFMDFHCGSTKLFLLSENMKMNLNSKKDYSVFTLFLMLAFMMKLPMYGVHLWLPKAHVEAPVAGSMVLAGVLLKLGAYGLFRSLHFITLEMCFWGKFLFMWSMVSMTLVGLMCFRQCDLKSLVAYSSVAHMSLILAACFSIDTVGAKGLLGILVSHGLCSSGLFFGVQCLYEKSGTRKMYLNRGIISISPMFCFFWFLLCVGNASAPPTLKLLSEFFLMENIMSFSGVTGSMFCGMSVFTGGLLSMYLYVLVGHGKWSSSKKYWDLGSTRKYLMLFLHSTPLYTLLFISKYIFLS